MEQNLTQILLETLELLEMRLRRIEFVLHGDSDLMSNIPVKTRIEKAEDTLRNLGAKSSVVSDVAHLHSRFPDTISPQLDSDIPKEADLSNILAIILTEAPSFPATASQLTSLNDTPIPPTEAFASLAALQPRIAHVDRRQTKQALEISDLRTRTALSVLRWHEIMILGQGRCWAEFDAKMKQAERTVRREEFQRQKAENEV
ncbi:hypothetical protein M501DRAFT_994087 [Patellaria atrata CBS 101060]|uniref:Nuclear distribution protein RO10 n=1 Tax=Patellaria atrata CBS 101060 TaxID=1346257 RepID=A0A9P4SIN8_9PEZI|nr:hypothetical protein M501DRAFT_994087 [Patellaria atrata CBS 101060]